MEREMRAFPTFQVTPEMPLARPPRATLSRALHAWVECGGHDVIRGLPTRFQRKPRISTHRPESYGHTRHSATRCPRSPGPPGAVSQSFRAESSVVPCFRPGRRCLEGGIPYDETFTAILRAACLFPTSWKRIEICLKKRNRSRKPRCDGSILSTAGRWSRSWVNFDSRSWSRPMRPASSS